MTLKITPKIFSGTSKIFDGTLEQIVRGLAQTQAQIAVGSVATLADNSTGVAQSAIAAPAAAVAITADDSDAVAKAEVEASLTSVRRNLRSLVAKTNEFRTAVPFFDEIGENLGGAAPTASLEAIDKSMTGTSAGGTLAEAAAFNTVVTALVNRTAQLTHWINRLCAGLGVDPVGNPITGVPVSPTLAAVSVTVGSTTAAGALAKTDADAALVVLADNIATLGAKLNELSNLSPSVTVIAA